MGENREREEAKNYFAGAIKKWHNNKIDYVFLTETNSVPYGYVLKEVWKQMYPGEKPPLFYRIDPQKIKQSARWIFEGVKGEYEINFEEQQKKAVETYMDFFKKRIRKDNAKIVIYDESMAMHHRDGQELKPFSQTDSLLNAKHKSDYKEGSLNSTANFFYDAYHSGLINKSIGEIFIAGNNFSDVSLTPNNRPTSKKGVPSGPRELSEDEKYRQFGKFKMQNPGEYNSTTPNGWIVKHPIQRMRAIREVSRVRKYGRELGAEIHTDLEHQKSLEQTLSSTTAVLGLLGSLFFISSTFTGNAIANISTKNSSFVGLILFLVGLIGAFFYFRSKKK